ncbi:MAG TPA: primosomal protein N' [Rhodospirillaceae bacterium]|nr:primosomal protein N' [Rhodospirillaceae bacterium]
MSTDGILRVAINAPLSRLFDYRMPESGEAVPGSRVEVPFGRRTQTGVVLEGAEGSELPVSKLKSATKVLDMEPLFSAADLWLIRFVSDYYHHPIGEVAAATMPALLRQGKALDPVVQYLSATATGKNTELDALRKKAPKQAKLLEVVVDADSISFPELDQVLPDWRRARKGLVDKGLVETYEAIDNDGGNALANVEQESGPDLNPDQRTALKCIREQAGFAVNVVDGVTGSGKTEIYLHLIASELAEGRQVLVLVPEIGLTPQLVRRFQRRLGIEPVLLHSGLNDTERLQTWRAARNGTALLIVGTRSAVFVPLKNPGLIIVDEEHESAFKQEDGVTYHGRDMAVVRARIAACPIIVASATPSLETRVNVERARYKSIVLPERFGLAVLPAIETIDMRASDLRAGQFLSAPLISAITSTIAEGEQSLLFLNRRGYAPLTLCRTCGHRFACPSCSAWLTEHRFRKRLQCHHCGYEEPVPVNCPSCDNIDTLVACGPGVERIAEEVIGQLPDARVEIMTSDTMRSPEAALRLIGAVENNEIDLLIGTQMVAKGHHFPNLTLVGIIDADLGLAGGDLRAAERTYQVLQQVSGRAGRAERPGRVLIQTFQPEHPVMRALAAGDRDGFMALETDARRAGAWPPFGRLAAVIVSSRDRDVADGVAGALARCAPDERGVRVLGPAPAPLALLRGRHRRRLLLKAEHDTPIQGLMRRWLSQVKVPSSARVRVDIDPYSFL